MKNYQTFILDNQSINTFIGLINERFTILPEKSGEKIIVIHDRDIPIIQPTNIDWWKAGIDFPFKSIMDQIAKQINHKINDLKIVYQKQNIFKYKIIW